MSRVIKHDEHTHDTKDTINPDSYSAGKVNVMGTIVGLFKGTFGSMVGLGGGTVSVPLLVSIVKLTQHQAHGTSLIGVLASGVIGAISYYYLGGGMSSVDVPAALVLAASSVAFAPIGVKLAMSLKSLALSRVLGIFMALSVPLVMYCAPKKGEEIKGEENSSLAEKQNPQGEISWENSIASKNTFNLIAVGVVTGLASGFFGVGGGTVMVPLLGTIAPQQTAIGTSLMAMIAPSFVALLAYVRVKQVFWKVAPSLIVGSSIGSFFGAKIATRLDEHQQRLLFACIIGGLSAYSLKIHKIPAVARLFSK